MSGDTLAIYRRPAARARMDAAVLVAIVARDDSPLLIPRDEFADESRWLIEFRAVDAGGVEMIDPVATLRLEFDETANLVADGPPRVEHLTVEPAAEGRLAVTWRQRRRQELPAADRFDIFIGPTAGPSSGKLPGGGAAATLSADGGDNAIHTWTSEPLEVGRSYRVAVRAVADDHTPGPATFAVASPRGGRAVPIPHLTVEVI
jgi:hypothetical protein